MVDRAVWIRLYLCADVLCSYLYDYTSRYTVPLYISNGHAYLPLSFAVSISFVLLILPTQTYRYTSTLFPYLIQFITGKLMGVVECMTEGTLNLH